MTFRKLTQISIAFVAGCASSALGYGVAFAHGGGEGMFKMADTDGDGKLSPDEHSAAAKKMFEMMDSNNDGKVTAEEMSAAHDKMEAKMGKDKMGKDKMDKAGKAHVHDKADEMSAADKIKVIDTNGDGVLTAEEHAAGAKTMFGKMDSDHDGFLSKTEMAAGHAKLMHKNAK